MKKILLAALLGGSVLLTGCAGPYSSGAWFSQIDAPLGVTNNSADCSKVGQSQMVNYLGLIALGDASVATAKKDAGISKVANVDYNYKSILGIINTTTTKVCGE